jgi:predicted CoA-substrate-specific enzyme activase
MKIDDLMRKKDKRPVGMGLEIGAISVKWVCRTKDNVFPEILPHGGNPLAAVRNIFDRHGIGPDERIVVTGQSAKFLLGFPYRSETQCLEKALSHLGLNPDILLSLGGETFSIYPMKNHVIKNIIASSKCAAGTGEFIVQQFQRMGMSLKEGIQAAGGGRRVRLATRCSVHCKSDATHKLNKGECAPGDIAKSLIYDLAKKVGEMVDLAQWPARRIVISGQMVLNDLFVAYFRDRFSDSDVTVVDESPYLEAFGASLYASELPENRPSGSSIFKPSGKGFERLRSLKDAEPLLDYRVGNERKEIKNGASYILGVDAGSTTTKAVLLNSETGAIGAACYLRTLGNPVLATKKCLVELSDQVGGKPISIIQAAATGSAREMVSVYLDNCLSFNEILAHARAAAAESPEVDTVFEIGGQDSKYISFQNGVPVDYAMIEGCSAGTGSFLEESASVDMGIGVADISPIALNSTGPIAFGERCAAFINTDLRNALQQGATQDDVVAGLVYAIADNYISRIVGPRHVGENLLFLGGVALNRSVALAMAARTRRKIVVPGHPELMGSIGAALKARDLLGEGLEKEKALRLDDLISGEMEVKGTFSCKSCENLCEIRKIGIRKKVYPFGGLCSKYEKQRHGGNQKEGRDLVGIRNRIMFEEFGPKDVKNPRGTIGLPMALTAYEVFPFYARLINELGYRVVLSGSGAAGHNRATAPICYPCERLHGAVDDLLLRDVDFVFIPHVLKIDDSGETGFHYTCPSTTVIPDIIRAAFSGISSRILSPHIGLTKSLKETTLAEIGKMGNILGVKRHHARQAGEKALAHYDRYLKNHRSRMGKEVAAISGEPAIVIAGRPYVVCSPDVNLALPKKITSRGYHVLSADMLPRSGVLPPRRDVWHFTRQITNAVAYVKTAPNLHICLVSCFSCGPDASMYHYIRRELAGKTFCYLEIDSHTAHAGFETRVGAFIDIIEEQRARGRNHA